MCCGVCVSVLWCVCECVVCVCCVSVSVFVCVCVLFVYCLSVYMCTFLSLRVFIAVLMLIFVSVVFKNPSKWEQLHQL